jgi:hypothetical protein
MLGWLKSLLSPQPAGQAHLLRRFGMADPTITVDGVVAEADLWRIDSITERTVHLFEMPVSGLERCILTYRAQIRTIDSLGRVYLEMWCRIRAATSSPRGASSTPSPAAASGPPARRRAS